MKVNNVTRRILKYRRYAKAMIAKGYERGGSWNLVSGERSGHRITAVEIDLDGKFVWVKIEKENA